MANTLKQMMDYAKTNPQSDYAKTLFEHIKSGKADADAINEGIDLTKFGRPSLEQIKKDTDWNKAGFWGKTSMVAKDIGKAITSSEQKLGKHLGTILAAPEANRNLKASVDEFQAQSTSMMDALDKLKAEGKDTSKLNAIFKSYNQHGPQSKDFVSPEMQKELEKGFWQTAGEVGGVALDIASAGTYGSAAKGAVTGELLSKVAKPVVETVGKEALGQTLKTIGKKTLGRAALGAGTGYAYDVAGNLQEGKTGMEALKPGMGTILGGAIPVAIGGIQATAAITKDLAPRFINSLIKPKQADFSYGKDPGRTVSAMGITGNSMDDFGNNINKARNEVGSQIGEVYANPANANINIDASDEIKKIDDAITTAAKGGKSNQSVVTALQNTKDALLYEHTIDAEGNIIKIGDTPRDLSKLTTQEAFDLKQLVANNTKFTGNPSDDKTVNSILKDIYGGVTEKLNTAVEPNNPEIRNLNEKYGDLISAEIATKNRDKIVKRADMISMPIKVGGATALITAISTGGAAIPAILAGAGAAALDKAMQSTAVKTRIAAWLASETPEIIKKTLTPEVRTVLYRLLPMYASKTGKD